MVKNKVAPPFRVAEFDMMHADGISYEGDVLDLAVTQKLVTKIGAWFRYGDMQLGQGREKVRQYLKENPNLVAEFRGKILAGLGLAAGDLPSGRRASRHPYKGSGGRGSCRAERAGELTVDGAPRPSRRHLPHGVLLIQDRPTIVFLTVARGPVPHAGKPLPPDHLTCSPHQGA